MKALKILIVEDELLTALHWKDVLEQNGYVVSTPVTSGISALGAVTKAIPDLVLMDIQLKGDIDGIETAKRMHAQYSFPIIFITECDDSEGKVFKNAKEAHPQSYLTKPVEDRTLLHAVELAIQNSKIGSINVADDGIFLPPYRYGKNKTKVLFKDILYIKANQSYSELYFETKETKETASYTVTLDSSDLFQQLACASILKVHRSNYVNIYKIDELKTSSVVIRGEEIKVSKPFLPALKNALTIINYRK